MKQAALNYRETQPKERQEYKPFVSGPNPTLANFIREYSTAYDPATDKYDVEAFDKDITVDKAASPKAIYDMHTYWSKKHWAAIQEYIRHYLSKKYYPNGTGLILDCFSGSGMTGVAAMMEGRPCVLVDASPAAAFISHCYVHPVEPNDLLDAYEYMMTAPYQEALKGNLKAATGEDISNLREELDWLYATKCDRCGGDALTEYVIYSERFQCPRCGEVLALFDCPEVKVPYLVGSKADQKNELKKRRVCPQCLKNYREPHKSFVVSARTKKFGSIPVVVTYECLCGCKPKRNHRRHDEPKNSRKGKFFQEYDQAKLNQIKKIKVPHWAPDDNLAKAIPYRLFEKMDFRPSDAQSLSDLFTHRNYWALAAILRAIKENAPIGLREALMLSFEAALFGVSRMVRESNTATMAGTYYLPQMAKEVHVPSSFCSKLGIARKSYAFLRTTSLGTVFVNNASSMSVLPSEAFDYIFTDPPYVDKIQYGELNFLWESWLGLSKEWREHEVIVNQYCKKGIEQWDLAMRETLGNCFTALKPGRWLSLCYHDTDPGTWTRLQDIIRDTGFEIHSVTVLDPKQKSQNQITAEKIAKGDLVINCLKPRIGISAIDGSVEQVIHRVSSRVREILIQTLLSSGGQSRDTLWNTVLKRLLTRGEMAEHRFDNILSEVAIRSESGRWFLNEELESLSESDLRSEENAGGALEVFARLRCMGVPVAIAAELAFQSGVSRKMDEDAIEHHIQRSTIKDVDTKNFRLGGRLRGCEFYDCLFFYLTRYLKARPAGKTPRRNLAEFLEEYLVRFRDGDKWLYRPPTELEAESLRKSRQSGLGRRIRQYVAYLKGEGDFLKERVPDVKTLVAWLRHCANFGLAEAGVILYEKGGLMGRLSRLSEDERYDVEDYYSQCRRIAGRTRPEEEFESIEVDTTEEVEEK